MDGDGVIAECGLSGMYLHNVVGASFFVFGYLFSPWVIVFCSILLISVYFLRFDASIIRMADTLSFSVFCAFCLVNVVADLPSWRANICII